MFEPKRLHEFVRLWSYWISKPQYPLTIVQVVKYLDVVNFTQMIQCRILVDAYSKDMKYDIYSVDALNLYYEQVLKNDIPLKVLGRI